jgi:hypothetical protein
MHDDERIGASDDTPERLRRAGLELGLQRRRDWIEDLAEPTRRQVVDCRVEDDTLSCSFDVAVGRSTERSVFT